MKKIEETSTKRHRYKRFLRKKMRETDKYTNGVTTLSWILIKQCKEQQWMNLDGKKETKGRRSERHVGQTIRIAR